MSYDLAVWEGDRPADDAAAATEFERLDDAARLADEHRLNCYDPQHSQLRTPAVLTRADGWYIQAGYGERAGTLPGRYALERQDGSADRQFRTELTDINEVVRGFVGFLENDPTLTVRFHWRPYRV